MSAKPRAIAELEKKYKLTIKRQEADPNKWLNGCCYVVDENNDMVRLNIVFNLYSKAFVDSMDTISDITTLRYLCITKNRLQRIEGFERLVRLEFLSLWSSYEPSKIEGLGSLVNLSELRVGCNRIAKVEGLQSLTKLEILHIRGLGTPKIEGLETFVNLRKLEGLDVAIQSGHCEPGFFRWSELKAIAAQGKKYGDLWFFLFLTTIAVEPHEMDELESEVRTHAARLDIAGQYFDAIVDSMPFAVAAGENTFTRNDKYGAL